MEDEGLRFLVVEVPPHLRCSGCCVCADCGDEAQVGQVELLIIDGSRPVENVVLPTAKAEGKLQGTIPFASPLDLRCPALIEAPVTGTQKLAPLQRSGGYPSRSCCAVSAVRAVQC